jgi:hypothetical protein
MIKFVFILILLFIPSFSYSQPSINFDTVEHDFGIVGHEDKIQHTFEFLNNGDKELMIEKISPS